MYSPRDDLPSVHSSSAVVLKYSSPNPIYLLDSVSMNAPKVEKGTIIDVLKYLSLNPINLLDFASMNAHKMEKGTTIN